MRPPVKKDRPTAPQKASKLRKIHQVDAQLIHPIGIAATEDATIAVWAKRQGIDQAAPDWQRQLILKLGTAFYSKKGRPPNRFRDLESFALIALALADGAETLDEALDEVLANAPKPSTQNREALLRQFHRARKNPLILQVLSEHFVEAGDVTDAHDAHFDNALFRALKPLPSGRPAKKR